MKDEVKAFIKRIVTDCDLSHKQEMERLEMLQTTYDQTLEAIQACTFKETHSKMTLLYPQELEMYQKSFEISIVNAKKFIQNLEALRQNSISSFPT